MAGAKAGSDPVMLAEKVLAESKSPEAGMESPATGSAASSAASSFTHAPAGQAGIASDFVAKSDDLDSTACMLVPTHACSDGRLQSEGEHASRSAWHWTST